jgi:hypothetical protein
MIENEGDHDDSDNDAVDEDHNDGSQPLHPFHLRKRLPNPSSERSNVTYYSPLNHLIDMQVCDRHCSFILDLNLAFGPTTFNPIWSAGFC